MIVRVEDPVMFNLLAKDAAERLGIDESIFRRSRARPPTGVPSATYKKEEDSPKGEELRPEELSLLEVMAIDRRVAERVEDADLMNHFESRLLADAATLIAQTWREKASCQGILDQLPTVVATRIAAALLGDGAAAHGDHDQIAEDCARRIEQRARRADRKSMLARLRQLEAEGRPSELRKELERGIVVLRQRDETRRD